ncbi:MAG: VanW family protein [Clostridia bacterium]|nr:VanW family protein [Clostridia bacterium]
MLALSAGIFFTCGFFIKVPKGVTVNNVEIGGLSRNNAVCAVRKNIEDGLKQKKLIVHGKVGEYSFTYPEIGYKDNVREIVENAQKGGSYTADISCYLNGLTEIASYICADESKPPVEPYAIFNPYGQPFTYVDGENGAQADKQKLVYDIKNSLKNSFDEVYVAVNELRPQKTLEDVYGDTKLLTSFTTYFDGSNTDRAHNIYLASQKINGCILNDGEEFSFNNTVGVRSEERGFRPAKIIENGEFVEGVGGGVCQVSTTLYNAALRAGCAITEYHAHSLAVSYVPPSFDAMVSGTVYDLKFKNVTGNSLFIRAYAGDNYVKFTIYGRGDGAQYDMMSRVTASIPAPEETTSDQTLVKEGRDGTKSEAFLTVTRDGKMKTVLLRRDSYAPVKRVVLEEAETEEGGE